MKQKYITSLLVFIVTCFFFALGSVASQSRSSSRYKITIYADEGTDKLPVIGLQEPFGHVFVGLTDGQSTNYSGWNPGGVKDESKYISGCSWDVRRTFDISESGYQKALQVINEWRTDRFKIYNSFGGPHCGDFAEAVAKAAGVQINLSFRMTGRNRPGLFGEYLRDRGAEVSASVFYVNSYVDTGISVKRGDKMTFRASGKVTFGPWVGSGGPEGIVGVSDSYSHFSNILHGALIGRVKPPGVSASYGWFHIGSGRENVSEDTGILELNVNDNQPKNNEGKFEVEVKVCKAG